MAIRSLTALPIYNEVQHVPWPLQEAELELDSNTMIPKELSVSGDPIVHFARRLDVVVWDAEVCGVAGG